MQPCYAQQPDYAYHTYQKYHTAYITLFIICAIYVLFVRCIKYQKPRSLGHLAITDKVLVPMVSVIEGVHIMVTQSLASHELESGRSVISRLSSLNALIRDRKN